jgi:hypothetical protein
VPGALRPPYCPYAFCLACPRGKMGRGDAKPTPRTSLFPTPSRVPGFFLTVTHNLHRNLPSRAHLSPGASRNPAFQVGSHTWQRLKPKTHYYCLLPKPPHRLPNPFQTNTPRLRLPLPADMRFLPLGRRATASARPMGVRSGTRSRLEGKFRREDFLREGQGGPAPQEVFRSATRG